MKIQNYQFSCGTMNAFFSRCSNAISLCWLFSFLYRCVHESKTTNIYSVLHCNHRVETWKPNNIHILFKIIQFSVDFTCTWAFERVYSCCVFFSRLVGWLVCVGYSRMDAVYECVAPSVFNAIVANNPISSDEFRLSNSFSLRHKIC